MIFVVQIVQEQFENLQNTVERDGGYIRRGLSFVGKCRVSRLCDDRHESWNEVTECKHDTEHVMRVDLDLRWRYVLYRKRNKPSNF